MEFVCLQFSCWTGGVVLALKLFIENSSESEPEQ